MHFIGLCSADINLTPAADLLPFSEDANQSYYEDAPDTLILLSRGRRSTNDTDKSVWEEIEDFYSDDNNMAMFCVLPIMVLVYGGCSAIYCVHKCRQYWRRRKHQKLKEEDSESLRPEKTDPTPTSKDNKDRDRPVSQISQAWLDLQSDPQETRWSGRTQGVPLDQSSPLPWQVPPEFPGAALAQTGDLQKKLASKAMIHFSDRGQGQPTNGQHPEEGKNTSKILGQPATPNVTPQARVPIKEPNNPSETRAQVNIADYATNRSSATKASDFSRFSDSRPIEIVPLSADPNLRVWDPLHRTPRNKTDSSRNGADTARPGSVQDIKNELMARYDALSTLQMAKKAAEILSSNAVEKNPFQRKPNKKKLIFIAE